MGRAPCCSKVGLQRGPWTAREDTLLTKYIQAHGEGQWRSLPKMAGLLRCGKSCRLRWMNYLRPNIKRGNIQPDEEDLIIRLHKLLGNRWSLIAGRLPGRTDNEIKNYWNTHLSKKSKGQEADRSANNKKKNDNNKNKNQNKKKEREEKVERTRTIVHLPKPIRLTSLSRNFQLNLRSTNSDEKPVSVPSSIHQGEVTKQNLGVSWPDFRERGILDGAVDEWDPGFAAQFHGPTKDDMLEKLFGEYLDLLGEEEGVNLDSFSEFS